MCFQLSIFDNHATLLTSKLNVIKNTFVMIHEMQLGMLYFKCYIKFYFEIFQNQNA